MFACPKDFCRLRRISNLFVFPASASWIFLQCTCIGGIFGEKFPNSRVEVNCVTLPSPVKRRGVQSCLTQILSCACQVSLLLVLVILRPGFEKCCVLRVLGPMRTAYAYFTKLRRTWAYLPTTLSQWGNPTMWTLYRVQWSPQM